MSYLNPEQSLKRNERADVAAKQFVAACGWAISKGIDLRQCSRWHYQLKSPEGRILNIYPGNCRLWSDPAHEWPYVRIEDDWDLLQVVRAAVEVWCERAAAEVKGGEDQ